MNKVKYVFVALICVLAFHSYAQTIDISEETKTPVRWGISYQFSPSEMYFDSGASSLYRYDGARGGAYLESDKVNVYFEFSGVSVALKTDLRLGKSNYISLEGDYSSFDNSEDCFSNSNFNSGYCDFYDLSFSKVLVGLGHKFSLAPRFVLDLGIVGGGIFSEKLINEYKEYSRTNCITKVEKTYEVDLFALAGGRVKMEFLPRTVNHRRRPISLFASFEYLHGFNACITEEVTVKEWIESNIVYYEIEKREDLDFHSIDFRLGLKWYIGGY